MIKFKVGDRVVAYASDLPGVRGTVQSVHEDGILAVHLDEYYHEVETNEEFNGVLVHPKQCRKLKPKAKKEPRRVWINSWNFERSQKSLNDVYPFVEVHREQPNDEDCVEFIEVIKKGNK